MTSTGRALDRDVATEVAATFGLGQLGEPPRFAASGWAEHNLLWRFDMDSGAWAVKEIGREPGVQIERAAAIEATAHEAGIACPMPIPAVDGCWTVVVAGRLFRCHEWVAGVCPSTNLSRDDAWQAGRSLGQLHGLELPCQPVSNVPDTWGEMYWRHLAERGHALGLAWSGPLASVLDQIMVVEFEASTWRWPSDRWIGSHKDVRPDNALRTGNGLFLVDWDAAGPVVPGREVATALRWWAPHENVFLDGYVTVAGEVDLSEGSGEDGGMLWWLELNVRLAVDEPRNSVRQEAVAALIDDLFAIRDQSNT